MTTIHKLEASEYDILAHVEDGTQPDPAGSIALVAEDECSIVGRMLLICPAHIEGTWVHEDYRKGLTGYRLMRRMEDEAKGIGLKKIFAYAEHGDVENYLERLGYKQCKVTVWEKDLCQ